MTVSLVVAATNDGAERARNWHWLRARYELLFPDWEIVEHTAPIEPWSKGASIDAAAARARGDILVIADADVLVARPALASAVAAVRDGAPWVQPHRVVYRLSERTTKRLLAGELAPIPVLLSRRHLERPAHRAAAGGGLVVLTADAFYAVGGIDPAFTGWGGDDISLARALNTLVGPCVQMNHPLWHLHHPTLRPADGRGSPGNELLASMYLDADGDREAMTLLCTRRVVA